MTIENYLEDKQRIKTLIAKDLNKILDTRGLSGAEAIDYAQKLIDQIGDLTVISAQVAFI